MIDWIALMRIGMTHLRLQPHEFWALTPVELMVMAGMEPGATPTMTRASLDTLCAQFPDT
ncbi:rcc01693 family protein [Amylibacter sp. IMCC11727]|uniref:rcc01693 family protein n=1 Tax=Amylibacter sp. IMCC11727 TaxID=3039851 RepID=UPI00244DC505|nr:rcc01693 family protein [Amylibacter sp. IMCC11727]WGI20833.1 phage tail assembly chaperone [Amylibacter sp. IMCC11727]